MAKGDILKAALQNPNNGAHRKAVIRSAICQEMATHACVGKLPVTLTATEICNFLVPKDHHLTQDNEDQLLQFSHYLSCVDTDPSVRPGYQLLGKKLVDDLGM